MNLDNSNRRLIEGVSRLLREQMSSWPTVSGENYTDVANVWPSKVPTKDGEPKEFPYGTVDIVSGSDTDLSVELDVKLRENTVKLVVFGEHSGAVEDLIDESEQVILDHWEETANNPRSSWEEDTYLGDWSLRQTDGFTPLVENEGTEGKLRYNRSVNLVFETVKQAN